MVFRDFQSYVTIGETRLCRDVGEGGSWTLRGPQADMIIRVGGWDVRAENKLQAL